MKSIGVLFVVVLCWSCTSSKIHFEDNSTKKVYLPYKVDSIKIVDTRLHLLPMDWEVPMIATKKREWIGNPKLSVNDKMDITMILKLAEDHRGIPAQMTFNVLEGVCKLSGKWNHIEEFAKFKGELIVLVPSKNIRHKYYGEISYTLPVRNGTEKHAHLLYRLALKNVVHKVVSDLEADLNK